MASGRTPNTDARSAAGQSRRQTRPEPRGWRAQATTRRSPPPLRRHRIASAIGGPQVRIARSVPRAGQGFGPLGVAQIRRHLAIVHGSLRPQPSRHRAFAHKPGTVRRIANVRVRVARSSPSPGPHGAAYRGTGPRPLPRCPAALSPVASPTRQLPRPDRAGPRLCPASLRSGALALERKVPGPRRSGRVLFLPWNSWTWTARPRRPLFDSGTRTGRPRTVRSASESAQAGHRSGLRTRSRRARPNPRNRCADQNQDTSYLPPWVRFTKAAMSALRTFSMLGRVYIMWPPS
mgnify:CR=1 FL=1